MIRVSPTSTLPTPAWELEIKTPVLTESMTLTEELVLNIWFPSMEDGMKKHGILLEIIGTGFYTEDGKCLVLAATCPGLFSAWFLPFPAFSLRLSSGSCGIPHFSPNNLKRVGLSGSPKDADILPSAFPCWRSYIDYFFFFCLGPIKRLVTPTAHTLTKFFFPHINGLYRKMETFCQPQKFLGLKLVMICLVNVK